MPYIGTYDSKIGFTVSFSNAEDSGYYECRPLDDYDNSIQFIVIIQEQREFLLRLSFQNAH